MIKMYIQDKDLIKNVNINNYSIDIIDDPLSAEVLFVGFREIIDEKFMSKFPSVKYIVCPSTGTDHIKVKNINLIKINPNKAAEITASSEFTLFLLLSVLRRGIEAYKGSNIIGDDIYGKTTGIIGYGRIGKNLAKYIRAMNGNVIWTDLDNKPFSKDYVLSRSDIVVVSVSSTPENKNLIDYKEFNLMKQNSFFVNISRGFVVNDNALLDSLLSKRIVGAAIDVVENINIYDDYRRTNNNLIITNHIAGSTNRSRDMACKLVLDDFWELYAKK